MSSPVTIGRPGQFREFERHCAERMEQAILRATARAARQATSDVRTAMRGAGLGRLSGAIGSGSDLEKGGTAHRRGGTSLSASGWLYIRGRSERTLGAIEAYTQGAEIGPRRGRWLAIATDRIPRRVGRNKMTPALYRSSGLERTIGPLEFLQGRRASEALLIVRNVSVDRFRRRGRHARTLSGRKLHASRERREFIVAFVLIRQTARSARFDPATIIATNAGRLPALVGEELRKEL